MLLYAIFWGAMYSKRHETNTTEANSTNSTNVTTTTTRRPQLRVHYVEPRAESTEYPELINITSTTNHSKRHLTDWLRLPDETQRSGLPDYLQQWLLV